MWSVERLDWSLFQNGRIALYHRPEVLDGDLGRLQTEGYMIDEFWDEKDGGFYYTGHSHEELITKTKDSHDSSIPSSNAMAATALLRLAKITGNAEFLGKAERTLKLFSSLMATSPMAAGQMLVAFDFYFGPTQEFAVIGDLDQEPVRQALRLIRAGFRPNKVVAVGQAEANRIPLLAGKTSRGTVTTYICQNFTCQEPVVGVELLQKALE